MAHPAADRRFRAVERLVSRWAPAERQYTPLEADRPSIAQAIRDLRALGRTPRWVDTLTQWADTVADESKPLAWALLQGSVHAANAAA